MFRNSFALSIAPLIPNLKTSQLTPMAASPAVTLAKPDDITEENDPMFPFIPRTEFSESLTLLLKSELSPWNRKIRERNFIKKSRGTRLRKKPSAPLQKPRRGISDVTQRG